ncbi:MAG: S8 family serine peptidase [Flavobacteriales bacterium]
MTLLKYDEYGEILWQRFHKAREGNASARVMQVLGDEIYVGGYTTLDSQEDSEVIVYDSDGNYVWSETFDYPGWNDRAIDIEVNDNNSLYLIGISSSGNSRRYFKTEFVWYDRDIEIFFADTLPSHVDNELFVRFNPNVMDTAMVNNTDKIFGNISDFVSAAMVDSLELYTGVEQERIMAIKVMKRMNTNMQYSTSRRGEEVEIPKFWSYLILDFGEEVDELQLAADFGGLYPMVITTGVNHVFVSTDCQTTTPGIVGDDYEPFQYFMDFDIESMHQESVFNIAYPQISILADDAWCISRGEEYIRVGVLDAGIRYELEEFTKVDGSSKVYDGYDYYSNEPITDSLLSTAGHGTSVAGIIGAISNNGLGIVGIAGGDMKYFETELFGDPSYPGLDTTNKTSGVALFDAKIGYSVLRFEDAAMEAIIENSSHIDSLGFGNAIHIMNHSWGSMASFPYPWRLMSTDSGAWTGLADAMDYAARNHVIMAVARGNLGTDQVVYPACFNDEWILSVGASSRNDDGQDGENGGLESNFSSYGKTMDFLACGDEDVLAIIWDEEILSYDPFTGTSAAAPHAAGIAALMLSYSNSQEPEAQNLAPEDIERLIEKTCRDRGTDNNENVLEYDEATGWGHATAGEALRQVAAPEYLLQHEEFEGGTYTLYQENIVLHLNHNLESIKANTYIADVYKVSYTASHSLPSGYELIDAWPLHSSSTPYQLYYTEGGNKYLFADERIDITSVNSTSANIEGYVYHIKQIQGGSSVNVWLPSDTGEDQKFAYTLHLFDPSVNNVDEAKVSLSIYPNPANEYLYITTSSHLSNLNGVIFDAVGKQIDTVIANNSIDISHLQAGFYTVVIVSEDRKWIYKFIKE